MPQVMSRRERAGYLKGQQEGREEGRQEERRDIALLLLTNRLGPLGEETTAQIHALDAVQLRALLDALLSFTSQTELSNWLATQGV